MVSIKVNHLGLQYPLGRRFSFAKSGVKSSSAGGIIVGRNDGAFVQALNDISFTLNAGDRLGLVGSNGAGKTSLLKILYRIFEPTSGSLEINGRVDALFNIRLGFRPGASGRRNIELRCLISGWSPEQIKDHMEDIITFSELGDFIEMPLKSYSQGMAARLAFAIATATDPEILLMDEWIGAGDASFQQKARKRMQVMADNAGIVVLASHNHQLLRNTCNKILHLEKGRVREFVDVRDWEG